MLVIIDYGMGNVQSVKNALEHLNIDCCISKSIIDINNASGLILPGVGAFKQAMDNLHQEGLVDVICQQAQKKPLLGICLGMQLLFEKGYEVEHCEGLKLLSGEVVLMEDPQVKIPQIGYNQIQLTRPTQMIKNDQEVYFVHSYYAVDMDANDLLGYVNYGDLKVPAIVQKGNIIGCQFHPEKSGEVGLKILEYFGGLTHENNTSN